MLGSGRFEVAIRYVALEVKIHRLEITDEQVLRKLERELRSAVWSMLERTTKGTMDYGWNPHTALEGDVEVEVVEQAGQAVQD